jgi:WD40 repeat protein
MAPLTRVRLLVLIALVPLLALCSDTGRPALSADDLANQTSATKTVRLSLGPEERMCALAFSQDGRYLAGGNWSRSVWLWQMPGGKEFCCVSPPADDERDGCVYVAFSPDGKRLATVHDTRRFDLGGRARLRIWNIVGNQLRLLHTLRAPNLGAPDGWRISFSPDGKTLVAGTWWPSLLLWDVATGKEMLHFHGGVAAAFAADGQTLISVSPYGRIHRWAAGTNRLLDTVPKGELTELIAARHVVFSRDRRQVAIGDGYAIWLKDVASARTTCRLEIPSWAVPLEFSPDGRLLAVRRYPAVSLFDTATGKEIGCVPGNTAAFSPDGTVLAWSKEGAVILDETTAVLAAGRAAPPAAVTSPAGVSLRAELVLKRPDWTLDRRGLSPEEFADETLHGEIDPADIDVTVRLQNTGDRPLKLHWQDDLKVHIDHIVGPGAINYYEECQTGLTTGMGEAKPVDIELKPGASHSVRTRLEDRRNWNFWTLPGEYRLYATARLHVSPAPEGGRADDNGFAYVWVDCAPLTIHVETAKNPNAQPLEKFHVPPPLGSLRPPPDDDKTYSLRRKLECKATLEKGFAAGTALSGVLDFLSDRYDMSIRVDAESFQRIGKTRFENTKVSLQPLAGVRLEVVLYLLLDPIGADWEMREGVLWIVPLAKPRDLADRLQLSPRYFRERIQQKLETRSTLKDGIAAGTPLAQALATIGNKVDISFLIDQTAFERAGIKDIDKEPTRLAEQTEVPTRQMLEELLKPLGATVVLREEMAIVVPAARR